MKRGRNAAIEGHRKGSSSQYAASLDALAEALNISRTSTKNLRRDGLSRNRQGYSIEEATELLRRRTLRVAHFRNGTAEAAIAAKTRKLEADAERAELELAREKASVVSRESVNRQWRCAVVMVKNRLLSLGRELAPRLHTGGPMECQSIINERVCEILRLLAHPEFYPAEALRQDLRQTMGTSSLNHHQGGHPHDIDN
jgi:biotin operon repressor